MFIFVQNVFAYGDGQDYYLEDSPDLEFDESLIEKWEELKDDLPELLPNIEDMTKIQIDQIRHFNIYIDEKTLTVNESDRVTRYWIKLKPKRGKGSLTYEAIRCETNQYKVYAYGYPDRKVKIKALKKTKWHTFKSFRRGDLRAGLAQDYFCAGAITKSAIDVIAGMHNQYDRTDNFEED